MTRAPQPSAAADRWHAPVDWAAVVLPRPAAALAWTPDGLTDPVAGLLITASGARPWTVPIPYPFDAAASAGPVTVLTRRRGTKALVLHQHLPVRELDRSLWHAGTVDYPLALTAAGGSIRLAHCPGPADTIVVEDALTGTGRQTLTTTTTTGDRHDGLAGAADPGPDWAGTDPVLAWHTLTFSPTGTHLAAAGTTASGRDVLAVWALPAPDPAGHPQTHRHGHGRVQAAGAGAGVSAGVGALLVATAPTSGAGSSTDGWIHALAWAHPGTLAVLTTDHPAPGRARTGPPRRDPGPTLAQIPAAAPAAQTGPAEGSEAGQLAALLDTHPATPARAMLRPVPAPAPDADQWGEDDTIEDDSTDELIEELGADRAEARAGDRDGGTEGGARAGHARLHLLTLTSARRPAQARAEAVALADVLTGTGMPVAHPDPVGATGAGVRPAPGASAGCCTLAPTGSGLLLATWSPTAGAAVHLLAAGPGSASVEAPTPVALPAGVESLPGTAVPGPDGYLAWVQARTMYLTRLPRTQDTADGRSTAPSSPNGRT